MRVTRLKLTNLRAIETAQLQFQPGFNLVVGVNGVGKTSVLHALGVCLSAIVKHTNRLAGTAAKFSMDDIRVGAEALGVECAVQIGAAEYNYLIHKPRDTSVPQERKAGLPREQVHATPERAGFLGRTPGPISGIEAGGRRLAVLFSTNRAVPSYRAPGKKVAAGGIAAAYADAFANRELRLGEFAAWMRVQQALSPASGVASRAIAAFEDAVGRFLPGYSGLRVEGAARPTLLINRGTTELAVRQLSDGERGMLALVLDLTRRLGQANPEMSYPAAESEAIVLIDEIDLHLHPKWQRQIVHSLTAAFPRCQFIATTHSPQVIGEVAHERIQIIAKGQVYSPLHSFGVDSSRVLEEIMDARPRTEEVDDVLTQLSRSIDAQQYAAARNSLTALAAQLGDDDPEVIRAKTLLDFIDNDQ